MAVQKMLFAGLFIACFLISAGGNIPHAQAETEKQFDSRMAKLEAEVRLYQKDVIWVNAEDYAYNVYCAKHKRVVPRIVV